MRLSIENKNILSLKKDPEDERDFKFKDSLSKDIAEENILTRFTNITPWTMTPVKDQGGLGSCVAFAVAAIKEWQEIRETIREGKVYDIKNPKDYSESWIYWNCKKIDPWPNEEGTSIRYAMKVLNRIGVPTEEAWPYDDVDYGKPKNWSHLIARWALIDSYWRVNGLNELKLALTNGPVVIGIPCFVEIFYTDDGFIPYPSNPSQIYGGHAVAAVAYDDSREIIIFKNSWGESWGRSGYGFLSYKYIEDFLWDAWACKDISVTKEMLKGKREL
jgi:C1A family cysteine protease